MNDDEVKYLRKRLYVSDKSPGICVDGEGYVRVALSSEMTEHDMLVLGVTLALKNKEWKNALLKRVQSKFDEASTPWEKINVAFTLLG